MITRDEEFLPEAAWIPEAEQIKSPWTSLSSSTFSRTEVFLLRTWATPATRLTPRLTRDCAHLSRHQHAATSPALSSSSSSSCCCSSSAYTAMSALLTYMFFPFCALALPIFRLLSLTVSLSSSWC